ncbi:hypothetical protein ACFYO7_17810 [Nocardia salmonicida]
MTIETPLPPNVGSRAPSGLATGAGLPFLTAYREGSSMIGADKVAR